MFLWPWLARLLLPIAVVTPLAVGSSIAQAEPAAQEASGPVLDNFDGPDGSRPDPRYWSYDIGPSAVKHWERGSLETYTDSPENVRLDGEGNLVIEARKSGDTYTSGRLVTRGKVNFGYGTVTARIKFPSGQGIWPAFWMLGSDIDTVGWPECGEIDIIELPDTATTYHVTVHGPPDWQAGESGPIDDLSAGFHNYWVKRQENHITIGIDGTTLGEFTPASVPADGQWVFNDNPMHVLLNVAVGGNWPGAPDDSTHFPATMLVDWFRFDPA